MNPNQPPYSQNYPPTLATPVRQQQPDAERAARDNFNRYYGPNAPRPQLVLTPPSMWSRVPVVHWIALAVGALAFVVHLSYQQTTSGSAGYSCTYTDLAGYLAAAALVVLAGVGWATRAAKQVADRLPVPLMAALTVLILALAFVHALRGSGTIMSPCDAMPMP